MAAFSLEAGIDTVVFPLACALRMRVSMSEIGSVILIRRLLTSWPWSNRALRPAWRFRAACYGPGRTCGIRRAADRGVHNGCAGVPAQHWAAAPGVPRVQRRGLRARRSGP